MDQRFKQFLNSLKQMALQPEEKLALRERLVAQIRVSEFVKAKPVRIATWSHFQWRLALMPLVVVLVVGGALSAAAERALPGEFLYPVKLQVNEPVGRFFSGSSPAEVLTHETGLLEKRLEEAEQLDNLNKLDQNSALTAEIKSNLLKQQSKVNKILQIVEPVVPVTATDTKIKTNTNDVEKSAPTSSAPSVMMTSGTDPAGPVTEKSVALEAAMSITKEKPMTTPTEAVFGSMPIQSDVKITADQPATSQLKEVLDNHKTIIEKLDLGSNQKF